MSNTVRNRSHGAYPTGYGAVGKLTPDQARTLAKKMLGAVAHGGDPAAEGAAERRATTLQELAEIFLTEHVGPKRKSSTATLYEDILNRLLLPESSGSQLPRQHNSCGNN